MRRVAAEEADSEYSVLSSRLSDLGVREDTQFVADVAIRNVLAVSAFCRCFKCWWSVQHAS